MEISTTDKIRQWSTDRNLHDADPIKQSLKLGEETGELFEGLAKGDDALIKDAIGDIYVVLTIMSQQLGFTIEECIEIAYDEIKDRRGKLVDGVFIKEEDLDEEDCTVCGGSGFSKPGGGYDSVCDGCAGAGTSPKDQMTIYDFLNEEPEKVLVREYSNRDWLEEEYIIEDTPENRKELIEDHGTYTSSPDSEEDFITGEINTFRVCHGNACSVEYRTSLYSKEEVIQEERTRYEKIERMFEKGAD